MAVQKDEALHEPLPSTGETKLYATKLTPSLSQAAMNLIIDNKRHSQSELNKKLFWSYKTWGFLTAVISAYSYMRIAEHFKYLAPSLLLHNAEFRIQVFYLALAIFMIVAITFTLLGEFTRFLKEEADSIPENPAKLFKFDLTKFANLPEEEGDVEYVNSAKKDKQSSKQALKDYHKELAQGENTQLIIYRNSPIAAITISKDEALTRDDQYAVRINGLGVRKVYANTDLQKDLIQWAYLRARDMYLEDGELKSGKTLRIFIELYSFDAKLIKTLSDLPGWQLVTSEPISDNTILRNVFDLQKQTWGIGMNITPKAKQ